MVQDVISSFTNSSADEEYEIPVGQEEKIFTVDEDGAKCGEYTVKDIYETLEGAGYANAYLEAAQDGVVYATNTTYADDGDTTYEVLAVDTEDDQVQSIFTPEEGEYISLDGYFALMGGMGNTRSIARSLDDYGFALVKKYDYEFASYGKYTGDDDIEIIQELGGQDFYLETYNDQYVVYENYLDDCVEYLDMESGEINMIDENYRISVLGLSEDGDALYYCYENSSDDDNQGILVKSYNLEDQVSTTVYEQEYEPAVAVYTASFAGGHVFVPVFDDGSVKWNRLDGDRLVDIDCTIETKSFYQYGTVQYESNTKTSTVKMRTTVGIMQKVRKNCTMKFMTWFPWKVPMYSLMRIR